MMLMAAGTVTKGAIGKLCEPHDQGRAIRPHTPRQADGGAVGIGKMVPVAQQIGDAVIEQIQRNDETDNAEHRQNIEAFEDWESHADMGKA